MCYNKNIKEMVVNQMDPIVIVPIVIGFTILLAIIMFGPVRKSMMSSMLKQQKELFDNHSDKLEGMMSSMLKTKKKILDNNADDIAYINQKEAELKSGGVRTTAKAVKEGLTGVESVFCKHCGASIDSDSKFCKKCGKEQ